MLGASRLVDPRTNAFLGIDVGTGSARAGVFDTDGVMLGRASRPIQTWRPLADHVQQSSDDIWAAVCAAVREAVDLAGALPIAGIGFDATCSLVVLDADRQPVSIDMAEAPGQDIIVWMDHRAAAQADRINATDHPVLRYVGGRVSLEMQTPKLLWLKQHRPDAWAKDSSGNNRSVAMAKTPAKSSKGAPYRCACSRTGPKAAHFLDLPDFLTMRATGALSRSLCSLVCKWTYLGHEQRWDESYFRQIGLGELTDESYRRIGQYVLPLGAPVGGGLSADAAEAMSLPQGTPVGTSAIDAHAGGIGVIGVSLEDGAGLDRRLALVGGTSSCHMAVSADPRFPLGVWDPYFSAMLPGYWLNEGGQSATGALIDHLVQTHAAYPALVRQAQMRVCHPTVLLAERLDALAAAMGSRETLTADLHVGPDFHGNRSPRADATLRGMVSGLALSATADDLARLYLATVQAIAYGTRDIIQTLNARGYAIDTILACGGGTKDAVFLREHSDATGCRIVLPREEDAVLLGAGILGAVASGTFANLPAAMSAMSKPGRIIHPDAATAVRAFHDTKYAVYGRLHDDQLAYRELMAGRTDRSQ